MTDTLLRILGAAVLAILGMGLAVLLYLTRPWPRPSDWRSPWGRLPRRWCMRMLRERP